MIKDLKVEVLLVDDGFQAQVVNSEDSFFFGKTILEAVFNACQASGALGLNSLEKVGDLWVASCDFFDHKIPAAGLWTRGFIPEWVSQVHGLSMVKDPNGNIFILFRDKGGKTFHAPFNLPVK